MSSFVVIPTAAAFEPLKFSASRQARCKSVIGFLFTMSKSVVNV